jgi:hypothetical protein
VTLTRYAGLAAIALAILATSCNRRQVKPARRVEPEIVRDVPAALRGTVGAEAQFSKRAGSILVSGFGLVVGLPGTGGGDLPPRIAGSMERQLAQMQMTRSSDALVGTIFEGKTPAQILRMKEVAVVIVYAAVVPGAPDGTEFDVYVTTVNKGPEISLDGGRLYSTELRPGPPAVFGSLNTKPIATARGPVFVNPFAVNSVDALSRQNGRVLGGGEIKNSMNLELILDNESHSRATSVVSAINNRFPGTPGGEPTARGRTGRIIQITVPQSYREDAESFVQTLLHVQIQQGQSQEFARRYVQAMKNQPALADDMSWCLQALPQKAAVTFLRELYDSTELGIKMAGLRAGAALGDAMAAPALKQLATDGPIMVRAEAVSLLGKLSAGPTVDAALRAQLDAKELSVRVAAYEALVERAEILQLRRLNGSRTRSPSVAHVSSVEPDPIPQGAVLTLPGGTLQGVQRKSISGKFILDIVPSGDPLIYVTQTGRPRIVVFGSGLTLTKPSVVSAWSDRLILTCDTPTDDFRIFYKQPDRMDDFGEVIPGQSTWGKAPGDLADMVEFLARAPSVEDPRPGLGLTYSEVVSALHAFHKAKAIPAAFAVEEDREQARLLAESYEEEALDRPDTKNQAPTIRVFDAPAKPSPDAPGTPEPMVVPLPQPKASK